MLDKNIHHLLSELYVLDAGAKKTSNIFSRKDLKNVLTLKEIQALNEAYHKFVFAESTVLLESSNSDRLRLWEKFLVLEDEAASKDEKKGGGFLSRAFKKVKDAGKAILGIGTKTRSLSQFGGKAGEQRKEFEELLTSSVGEVLKSMNAAVGNFKEYPNMKSNEEFQKMTTAALAKADELISQAQDETIKASMYEAVKKWISYVLDQKLGDYYKHFEEAAIALGELIKEAEGEGKEDSTEKKSSLGTKSGQSRTLKGLKSNVFPAVLGAVGAVSGIAAGILKAHPDLLGQETIEVVSQGDPAEVEKLVTQKLGPLKITDWTAQGSADQVYQHMFGKKPQSSEDYVNLFKALDPSGKGDAGAGAKNLYDMVGIRQGGENGAPLNSDYVLKRLSSMDPKKAFNMPGVGPMERWGGRAGIPKMVSGLVTTTLTTTKVAGAMKTALAAAGMSAAGATALGATAGLAAGGILSAIAVKLLRNKSLKNSRAAWLDSLIDKVGEPQAQAQTAAEKDPPPVQIDPQKIEIDPGGGTVNPAPALTSSPEGGGEGGGGGEGTPGGNEDGGAPGEAPSGTPDGGEGGGGEEDEGEEDMTCTPEEMQEKLTAVLSQIKFKGDSGQKIVKKILKDIEGMQFNSLAELETAINAKRTKKLKPATAQAFANALAPCFGFGEEDDEGDAEEETETTGAEPGAEQSTETGKPVNKLGGSDLKNIIDDIMKDMDRYLDRDDATMRPVSRDQLASLVKYLNDKGKLQYAEGDYNTGNDNGEMIDISTIKGGDDKFVGSIPPAYKGIIKTWKQSQPEISNEIDSIIGDKVLPLYLLANRRALVETLRLIYKHARLLHERKLNSSAVLTERWQRLAGILI